MELGTYTVMVSMIFSSLASVFVITRLATRIFPVRHVGLDVWLMGMAAVFSFGVSAAIEIGKLFLPWFCFGRPRQDSMLMEVQSGSMAWDNTFMIFNQGKLCK